LLFLAGLEIDLGRLRGRLLRLAGSGFLITLVLGLAVGGLFKAAGTVRSPLFLAITLGATSLGLVVPVLKDAGEEGTALGQLTIGASSVADFGAVLLLTLFFSGERSTGTTAKVVLLAGFAVLVAMAAFALSRLNRSMRFGDVLVRLQDTTAEIRVRIAVLLLVAFVAMAERFGLETILGAFLAGGVLNFIDRDSETHPHFRLKLEAIGYGFVVPVFFVTSGLRFDLDALFAGASTLVRVPVFLAAILLARALPALVYRRLVGPERTVIAGLLQATTLPFVVAATQIGLALGAISAANAAALVAAALLSVLLFPIAALALLRREGRPAAPAPAMADAGMGAVR
jgi:Kef-type K+ transport system membrane component KefB